MTIADRIMQSEVVRSGEPFRANDVRGNLGINSETARSVLRQLAQEGRLVSLWGGRFQRASRARDWLTNRGNCWPVPQSVRGG